MLQCGGGGRRQSSLGQFDVAGAVLLFLMVWAPATYYLTGGGLLLLHMPGGVPSVESGCHRVWWCTGLWGARQRDGLGLEAWQAAAARDACVLVERLGLWQ